MIACQTEAVEIRENAAPTMEDYLKIFEQRLARHILAGTADIETRSDGVYVTQGDHSVCIKRFYRRNA